MADSIFTPSTDFFGDPSAGNASLIQAQVPVSDPSITTMQTGTSLVIPNSTVKSRVDNFPDDLYDLSPTSHLMRFLGALMGDSGAGAVARRYLMTRIQATLTSSNFVDLDGFYGAIFSMSRQVQETLPINPLTDLEVPDQWDSILATDAPYRSRITMLAASIPLAGTYSGLKMAAEAITGVECEVYEAWKAIDTDTTNPGPSLTWDEVTSTFPTWNDLEGQPWGRISGFGEVVGFLGVNSRAEVIVRPKKAYDTGTEEGALIRAQDELFLNRVLRFLKPASVVMSVDTSGLLTYPEVPVSFMESDSDFWEVITSVTPSRVLLPRQSAAGTAATYLTYPLAPSQIAAGVSVSTEHIAPVPAMTNRQGDLWAYAGSVSSSHAYSITVDNPTDVTQAGLNEVQVDPNDTDLRRLSDGTLFSYRSQYALADPGTVIGGLLAEGIVADVYSGPREVVPSR